MTITTTGTGTTSTTYYGECPNKLPCGICRLTMSACPLWSGYEWRPAWRGGWDTTPVYCTTGPISGTSEVNTDGRSDDGEIH